MEHASSTENFALTQDSGRSRNNESRYLEVEHEGWFLRTREGLRGPFGTRREAEQFLGTLIDSRARRLPHGR